MASILDVVRDVKGPRPVLSRETEDALTPRQREVLDQLHEVFLDGFAHLTMAEMAAAASCSLRTLYEVATGLAPKAGRHIDVVRLLRAPVSAPVSIRSA